MDLEPEEFIEHFGKRGMKWGQRRQNRLDRVNRVASGTASKKDKAAEALLLQTRDLIRGHGSLKKASAVKSKRITQRRDRIVAGKATTKDMLVQFGSMRTLDLLD